MKENIKHLLEIAKQGQAAFYQELIDRHIKPIKGTLTEASIDYFLESGHITGGFRTALQNLLKEHDEIVVSSLEAEQKPSKPLSELHKDTETCEAICALSTGKKFTHCEVSKATGIIHIYDSWQNDIIICPNGDVAKTVGGEMVVFRGGFQIVSLLIDRGYVIGKG